MSISEVNSSETLCPFQFPSATTDPRLLLDLLMKEARFAERMAVQLAVQMGDLAKMDRYPKIGINEHFMTRCGIAWKWMAKVNREQFDELRREHQVSKNRCVGYGVRYACTRNAKARDNCPYLMLCMPDADGTLKVYSRNAHTHPVKRIRTREVLHSQQARNM